MNQEMGILAKKIGMTQLFDEEGNRIPITVLLAKDVRVTGHRTAERDGYTALQLGFDEQKPSRVTKPLLGQFAKVQLAPQRWVRELRVPAETLAKHPIGSTVPVDVFQAGALVDVTATSKGKGFQGVIKRHHMAGEKASHGQHEVFRHGGSIGCRKTPGRVFPGKRMAGQMGNERITVQNLKVARIVEDEGLVLVRGAVPGPNGGYVTIRHSVKLAARKRAGHSR